MTDIEFGLDTFGAVPEGRTHAAVLRDIVEEAKLADRLGIDAFNVGEHHRKDFAVSAPSVLQAALAASTERIKLGTAVTVLSSDDPVRVWEQTSTIQALSNGRAEVTLGRGSFTESFPLFGYDLSNYERLFSEKVDLYANIRDACADGGDGSVNWTKGVLRAPLNATMYPAPETPFTTWIGVGGSPESVERAARYKFPLMIAIIGGDPLNFRQLTELYRDAFDEFHGTEALPVGTHSPGFVWDDAEEARQLLLPHALRMRNTIGRERGWGIARPEQVLASLSEGANYVGEPEFVAQKIVRTVKALGLQRFVMKYDSGLSHEHLMRSIELYGTQVIPRVRELL